MKERTAGAHLVHREVAAIRSDLWHSFLSLTKESHGQLMVSSGGDVFYFRSFWPRTLPSHYLLEFDTLTSYSTLHVVGALPFNPASIFKNSLLWLMGSIPCTAGEISRS